MMPKLKRMADEVVTGCVSPRVFPKLMEVSFRKRRFPIDVPPDIAYPMIILACDFDLSSLSIRE